MLLIMMSLLVSNSMAFEVIPTLPNMVRAAEIKYDLPKGLLSALIYVESRGNHKAFVKSDGVSGKSSVGLTQMQLDSARFVGFTGTLKELRKPETNIEYGAKFLKYMLTKKKNNIAWALTCYNSGISGYMCENKRYSHYVGLILNAWMEQNENTRTK